MIKNRERDREKYGNNSFFLPCLKEKERKINHKWVTYFIVYGKGVNTTNGDSPKQSYYTRRDNEWFFYKLYLP